MCMLIKKLWVLVGVCLFAGPLDAQSVDSVTQRGLAAYQEGNYILAVRNFLESFEADSIQLSREDSVRNLFYIGRCWMQISPTYQHEEIQDSLKEKGDDRFAALNGNVELASRSFKECLKTDPEGPYAGWASESLQDLYMIYQREAIKAYNLQEFAFALRVFDLAIKHKPDHPDLWLHKAYTQQQLGDSASLQSYLKVLELDPNQPDALARLSEHYLNQAAELDAERQTIRKKALRKEQARSIQTLLHQVEPYLARLHQLQPEDPRWKKHLLQVKAWKE